MMQTSWLPQSTCDALNRINQNFLWGITSEKRKLHLLSWKQVTKKKDQGGLGIREARKANIAMLGKMGGQLVAGIDKMWLMF